MTLYDSCDSLTPANGVWDFQDDGGAKLGTTLTIDTVNKIEGAGCIDVVITANTLNSYVYKRPPYVADLSLEPIIRFRIFPATPLPPNFEFILITGDPGLGEWVGHSYGFLNSLNIVQGEWNVVEIDSRRDNVGNIVPNDALKLVRQSLFYTPNWGVSFHYKLDFFETLEGQDLPGGFLTVNGLVNGVSSPILTEIVEKNIILSERLTRYPLNEGIYTVKAYFAGFTQSQTVTIATGSDLTINFNFTYIPSTPPLHTEGGLIKNSNSQIVYLHGINLPGFLDDPAGYIYHYNLWEPDEMRRQFKTLKAWGMNIIRLHICAGWWIQDTVTFSGNPPGSSETKVYSYRNNLKAAIQIAAEEGLYVKISNYSIVPIDQGNGQTGLPFPPYSTAAERAYISSEQSYVNYMVSLAQELGVLPNVLLNLWNEPVGNEADWFRVAQLAITAMRQYTDNIITVQSGYCGVANLSPGNPGNWIEKYPLTGGNIGYTTHIYRYHGTFNYNSNSPTDYNYVKTYLNPLLQMKNAGYPILIDEGGGVEGDLAELECYDNWLRVLGEFGIGYIPWVWREDMIFKQIDKRSSLNPNSNGKATIRNIYSLSGIVTHVLTVESNVAGTVFTVDGISKITPLNIELIEGEHILAMPSTVSPPLGGGTYTFTQWSDGDSNPVKTVNLVSDLYLNASYVFNPPTTISKLNIHSFYKGVEVNAEGIIVETGLQFTTPAVLEVEPISPALYTVNLTYNSVVKTVYGDVAEGETIRLDVEFYTPIQINLLPIAALGFGLGLVLSRGKGKRISGEKKK